MPYAYGIITLQIRTKIKEVLETNTFEDLAFNVEFMSCVVDKADDLRVLESDSHFSEFSGVHPSKINQGKLLFLDLIMKKDRETVMKQLCKKNSPYIYIDFYIKNENGEYILAHCLGQNIEGTTKCRLALADVSQSQKKSELLKEKADRMNRLIDLVEGGVCLFKVTQDMHFETFYMNKACARFFNMSDSSYAEGTCRLDEYIHPEDKSGVYQAVGNSMATKKPINMETRVMTDKNSFIWIKVDSAIQSYESDGCPVFHAVFTDITKLKEAERKADSERDLMVNIFKNLPGPLFYTDLETPFVLDVVSEDFIRLIGYSRTELFDGLGGDLTHLIISSDIKKIEKDFIKKAKKNKTVKIIYTLKTKDGRLIDVVDKRKIVGDSKREKTTIGIIRDASAIKVDEELGL